MFSQLVSLNTGENYNRIYYQSASNTLCQIRWQQGVPVVETLPTSAYPVAPVTGLAGGFTKKDISIYYLSTANKVCVVKYPLATHTWVNQPIISANAPVPANGGNDLGCYVLGQDEYVVYVAKVQQTPHITVNNVILVKPNGAHDNLTDIADAPSAQDQSTLYCTKLGDTPTICYLADDGTFHYMQGSGTSWNDMNVSKAIGKAPKPIQGSSLMSYVSPGDGARRFYYVGENYHLIEARVANNRWMVEDMTSFVGGANVHAQSGLAWAILLNNAPALYYVALNGDIHEMRWNLQLAKWVDTNITTIATGAVLVSAGTRLGVYAIEDFPRIQYMGSDNAVHEIRYDVTHQHYYDIKYRPTSANLVAESKPTVDEINRTTVS